MHARTRRCRSGFRAGRASHSGDMVCMHARTRRWGSRVELPGTGAGWQIARVVVASRVVWLWLSVGTARDSRERERRGERSISRRLRSGFTRGSSCVLRGFGLVCLLVYGIPTFDSESFELELGTQWESMGHLWLQFRPNPFSVFGDQRFRPMYTMTHERTTLTNNFAIASPRRTR